MLKTIFYTSVFFMLVFITGCNSCSQKQSVESNSDLALDFESLNVIDSIEAVFYALPSPEEIISYIKDHNVDFNPGLLHNYKEAKLYAENEKKAVVLGVYFADLAYISAFRKSDFSPEYISTVDYLMKEININPDFTKQQQQKIIDSSLEPDSLYMISRELYDKVISYLQEYDEGKTLSLISVGTLLESLYISTYLHKDFVNQKEAIDRIAEQKLLFEDIVIMMNTYKENAVVSELIRDLKVLQKSFDNLEVNTAVNKVEENKDGSLHIKGKNSVQVTEEDYYIFVDNVNDFRTKLIRQ
ncbi:hypothetical protein E9993_13200 [Labilibacter sediminis]|nr:hypothetical protein E9993_13200 [Labilibacter sediminis]